MVYGEALNQDPGFGVCLIAGGEGRGRYQRGDPWRRAHVF
jgi:hypothetical protein